MKKIFLLLMFFCASLNYASAQLDDGCKALDFTITDINSNTTVNLYSLLDSGKYVFVDMFATWCGPCWNYHQAKHLENLYTMYGPGTATDDVRVIAIDVDANTTAADMNGTGQSTAGNWLAGTIYPIANPDSAIAQGINNDYEIAYFPTIYMICPDKTIKEVGQQTAAQLYAEVSGNNCPAKLLVDALPYTYGGDYVSCDGDMNISIDIKNRGWNDLTNATVNVKQAGTVIATQNWTGNLTTYQTASVNFGKVSCNASVDSLEFEVVATGDALATNNVGIIRGVKSYPEANNTTTLKMELKTDSYAPTENSWILKDAAGTTIDSGTIGSLPATSTFNKSFTLSASSCYTLEVFDGYGDGMRDQSTQGHVKLMDANDNQIFFNNGSWRRTGSGIAQGPTNNVDVVFNNDIQVYPNPASESINVAFDLSKKADVQLQLIDMNGKVIFDKKYNQISLAKEQINVKHFAAGFYNLQVKTDDAVQNMKVVLTK